MRLLLVEDDVMVASGIKLGLTDAGYAVDWVGSGERARRCCAPSRFVRAIIDIGLPGMDGLELTRRLRRPDMASPAMPVLILTARDACMTGCRGWTWAPTTTWSSPSSCPSCWRACVRCCGARRRPPRRC
jgi:two-component system OmpR family response regulator